MEGRKWEELPSDCLVNIFVRVDLESMVENVPLVCKCWYKATLSPNCWEHLDFTHNLRKLARPLDSHTDISFFFSIDFLLGPSRARIFATNFLKLVLNRFGGCAKTVKLSSNYSQEALTHLALKCPALKELTLLDIPNIFDESLLPILSSVIGIFKKLESLEICSHHGFVDVVTEIGAHCENFVSLNLSSNGIFSLNIEEDQVMAIVNCLPRIKCLTLRSVHINQENMIKLLKGCVELVRLVVSGCRGFDEHDEEILKVASHIPTFLFSDCRCVVESSDKEGDDDYDLYDFPV